MASYSHPLSPNRRPYDRYAPPYERYRDDHIPYPSQFSDDHRSYPPPPAPRYYDDYDDRSRSWIPPSPPAASYEHPRASSSRPRDQSGIMATPMLEPSESWKDSHYEPPPRHREPSPIVDWHRTNNATYYAQDPPDRGHRPRNASYDSYRPPPDRYEPEEYWPPYDNRVASTSTYRPPNVPTAPRADRAPHNSITKPHSPLISKAVAQSQSPLPAQSNIHQPAPTTVAISTRRSQPKPPSPVCAQLPISRPQPEVPQSNSTPVTNRPAEPGPSSAATTDTVQSLPSVSRESRAPRKPESARKPVSRSSSRSSIASSIASSRASSPMYSGRSESVTNQGSMTTVTEVMSTPGADSKPESGGKTTSRAQSVHRSSRHSSVGLDLPGFDLPGFGDTGGDLSPPAKAVADDPDLPPRPDDSASGLDHPLRSPATTPSQTPNLMEISATIIRPPDTSKSSVPSSFQETAKVSPAHEHLPTKVPPLASLREPQPTAGSPVAIAPPEPPPSPQQMVVEDETPLVFRRDEPATKSPSPPVPDAATEELFDQRSQTPEPAPVYRTPQVLMELEYERALTTPKTLPEAKSLPEVLRYVVERRLPQDLLLRENRVEPIISANLRLAPRKEEPQSMNTTAALFSSVTEKLHKANDQIAATKLALRQRLAERTESHLQKLEHLDEEYLDLRIQWLSKNAALDNQARVLAAEQAELQPVATSGRTTRRSTAMMGDLVRSDLEYEQILASLGNDELTDPAKLCKANLAIIPDMATVEFPCPYVFDDSNHLVRDPATYYGPTTGIHDWTEEETNTYQETFALYPKQFGVIAEALPGKTPKQCVDFYYLHKKALIDFRKIVTQFGNRKGRGRGRRMASKKGSALMKDIRQHDAEVHKSDTSNTGSRRRAAAASASTEGKKPTTSRRMITIAEDSSTAASTPEPEGTKRKRRRVLASAQEDDEADSATKPAKRAPRRTANTRKPKPAVSSAPVPVEPTEEVLTTIPTPDPPPPRAKPKAAPVHWSEDDKSSFLALLSQHGNDFKRIAASMPNKTTIQVTNFYKANAEEMGLASVVAGSTTVPSSQPARNGVL